MCGMSTPSPQVDRRTALWDSMLDAEMNSCYWDLVSARYTSWDLWIKITIAVTASGTVAGWSIWAQNPGAVVWKTLSGTAALVALFHPYLCSSERLKRSSELVATWKEVFIDYELLWYEDGVLESNQSWAEFEAIKRREAKIDETRLPRSEVLIEKAYRHVLEKRRLVNG